MLSLQIQNPQSSEKQKAFCKGRDKTHWAGAKPVLTVTGSECLPVTITSAVCIFVSLEFGFNFTLEDI